MMYSKAVEQAKRQGYLVANNWQQHDAIWREYYQFCKEDLRPLIAVTRTGKSACLRIDTDPVFEGGSAKRSRIVEPIRFGPTPELRERCKAIVACAHAEVHSGFSKRAGMTSGDDELFSMQYVNPETAIAIAKDLYAIWLEAKPLLPRMERRPRAEQGGA